MWLDSLAVWRVGFRSDAARFDFRTLVEGEVSTTSQQRSGCWNCMDPPASEVVTDLMELVAV